MSQSKFTPFFLVIVIFAVFTSAIAQIPQKINYQGRLTDAGGEPVANGPYLVKFKIYGSESGVDSLWTSGFQNVQVTDGLFNYILGANIPILSEIFGPGSEPFLGITIGTDPEISPRTRITSVGYSFQSLRSDSAAIAMGIADNIVTEAKIQTNAVTGNKILDGTIQFSDIGQNGAVTNQVMKWNGAAWVPAEDETGEAGGWTDAGSVVKLSGIDDSVGIGTDTPTAKLHVYHSETKYDESITGIYSKLDVDGAGNDIYGVRSEINSNDNDGAIYGVYSKVSGITPDKTAVYGYVTGGGIMTGVMGHAYDNGTSIAKRGVFAQATGAGTNNYGLYASASGGTNNYAGYFELGDVIVNNGNLGIGTNSPSAKLHIDGTPGVDGIMFPDGTLQTTAASIDIPLILDGSVNTGNKAIIEGINNDIDTDAKGVYGENVNWGTYAYLGGQYGVYGAATSGGGGAPVVGETIGTGTMGRLGGNTGVYGMHGPSGNFGQLGTSYCAVEGTASGDDDGILGVSSTGDGVEGSSSSGNGVLGISGATIGVYGRSYGTGIDADGVKGENITSGNTGELGTDDFGVLGTAVSTNGVGVKGTSNDGYGVYGESNLSDGVYGYSTAESGVYGASDQNEGVYGVSFGAGSGVYGRHDGSGNYGQLGTPNYGVVGDGGGNVGVYGASNTNTGVYGYSETAEGVKGINNPEGNTGSLGTEDYGVYGFSFAGDAGYFEGDLIATGKTGMGITSPLTRLHVIDTVSTDWTIDTTFLAESINTADNFSTGIAVFGSATSTGLNSVTSVGVKGRAIINNPSGADLNSDAFHGISECTAIEFATSFGIKVEASATSDMPSSAGLGAYAATSGNDGSTYGVNVYATTSGTGSYCYGVSAMAESFVSGAYANYGLSAYATGAASTNYGVYGYATGALVKDWAGYFSGDCRVTGTFDNSKSTTIIDHPLDPENKYLVHNSISSPDLMNVYNGNVVTDNSGEAEVILPDYFTALNKDFRYQLTVIGDFAQAIIADEIDNNRFAIRTDKPFIKVSWMVTGIRQDPFAIANPTEIERNKSEKEAGKYLHPESYGLGEEFGVDYENHKKAQSDRGIK